MPQRHLTNNREGSRRQRQSCTDVLPARTAGLRRALGAARGRLVRQLLAESLVVALLAGVVGFGASFRVAAVIVRFGEVPAEVLALRERNGRALLAATAV